MNSKEVKTMLLNFKEVSCEDFHKVIGPLNIKLSHSGNYPYTTHFKLNDNEVGRMKGKKYFLAEKVK